MVRQPLTAEQIAAGQRLGTALRAARAGRSLVEVALAAGISPETLRKVEAGRRPAPAFGTVVCLSHALDVPLSDLADVWLAGRSPDERAVSGEAESPRSRCSPNYTSRLDRTQSSGFDRVRLERAELRKRAVQSGDRLDVLQLIADLP
jgi:transcriptional regulator with XRE-family HTH domain